MRDPVLAKTSLKNCASSSAPDFAALLPDPLSYVPPKEAPGEEEEHENAKDQPAGPLDNHLQAVNLYGYEIANQAEGSVP